jgi:redox-sensitive bicupin YhaK (pirin superfamily)
VSEPVWSFGDKTPWIEATLLAEGRATLPDAGITPEMVAGIQFRRRAHAVGEFGPGQFWVSETMMPAGKFSPLHHEHLDKFIYVVEGSMTFNDGTTLSAGDSVVMFKDHKYGFSSGPDGVRFLLVRSGDAPPILD